MEEIKMGCQTGDDQSRQFVDSGPTCPRCGSTCNETNTRGKYFCSKCGYTFEYSVNKIL